MRFGLRLISYLGSSEEMLRLAVLGEKAGFDSVWFPHDTFMHNTWVLSTAAARETSSIEIGTVGTNPYTTDPCEIATYAATLDELSGGRLILGVGVHTEKMVEWTGIDASDYMQRTREAIDIIRQLLAGETVEYSGECFNWGKQCYLRMPVLRPDMPIYAAGFGGAYLQLCGECGDGSLPMITPPASAGYMVSKISAGIRSAGKERGLHTISGCAWLSLSASRRAASDVMRKMAAYFGPYLEEPALDAIGLSSADMAPLGKLVEQGRYDEAAAAVQPEMLALGIAGTPHDIIEEIERLAAAGIDEVNLGGPLGPDPVEAIRLMGEQVIPFFRSRN